MLNKDCLYCGNTFETKDKRKKFCDRSCSASYNNALREPVTNEQRAKVSEGLRRYYQANPNKVSKGKTHSEAVGKGTRGKYNKTIPDSILNLSSRTVGKILKRMGLGCCICGWDKGSCDIHHINGRKVENADEHWNLTHICPNCHREYHSGNDKLKNKFVTLVDYIGNDWKDYYYG